MNAKSDVNAKIAFIEELKRRGFAQARITASPADIIATKGGKTYYFEVKYTKQEKQYFGAATLTEWEAAFQNEESFWFVVAMERDGSWIFHEYTPNEFLEFSYIPPFKIFFNIPVGSEKASLASHGDARVGLTRERLDQLSKLYDRFRSNTVPRDKHKLKR